MAYISALDEEEDRPAQAAAPGAGSATPAQAAAPASRFVEFGRYLAANRDAAQASANRVAQGIEDKGNAVQTGLAGAQQQFNAATSQPLQSATTEELANETYTGPNSLADTSGWSGLQSQVADAQDAAQATQTPGGVGALTGGQSEGGRRFNAALVGNVGAERFGQLRERFGRMADGLSAANAASVAQANTARAQVDSAASGARSRLDAQAAQQKADRDWYDRLTSGYSPLPGDKDEDFNDWLRLQSGDLHGTVLNGQSTAEIEKRITDRLRRNYGNNFAERYARLKAQYGG